MLLRKLRQSFTVLTAGPGLLQGTGTVFDQALYSLTNFLTGVLLARALPQEDFGVYVLALSLIMAAIGIQRALISTPYTVFAKSSEGTALNLYAGSAFVHHVLFAGTCAVICLISVLLLYRRENVNCVSLAVALGGIGILSRDFVRSTFLASLQVRRSVMAGVAVNVSQLAILWILFTSERLTMCNAFLVVGITSLLGSLSFFLAFARPRVAPAHVAGHFRSNVKLGKWMLGGSLLLALSAQSYIWLLGMFTGAKAVAALGVASSLANALSPLLQGVTAFLLPKMVYSIGAPARPRALLRLMVKSIAFLSLVQVIWLICGLRFGEDLLTSIYSSTYSGYGVLLGILIVYSLVSSIMAPITAALDALKRSDVSFRSSVTALIVTVSSGIVLIHAFGANGAAVSALLANLTNLLLRWRGLRAIMSDPHGGVA